MACVGGRFVFPSQDMIGVFDSGFGGLTVLASLVEALPQYDYLFLADSARVEAVLQARITTVQPSSKSHSTDSSVKS